MKVKSKRCGDNTIIPTSESQVEDGVRPGAVAVPPTVGVLLLSASEGVLTSHLNKNFNEKVQTGFVHLHRILRFIFTILPAYQFSFGYYFTMK